MTQEIKHYQINGRYKIQFERSATKGVIGYKVEVNSDSLDEAELEASKLRKYAEEESPIIEEKK